MARAGGRTRTVNEGRPGEESDFFVRALARGLQVLALFDIEHPEWGLSEICTRTGMSKTTAYRMTRTLESIGYLAHDAETERYHLGRAVIPNAYLALSHMGFIRSTHRFLEELAEVTGETVELTVGGPDGAVVVDEVATAHPFRLNRPTGRILNSWANSSFRLHVAYRPEIEQRKSLARAPHRPTADTTIDFEEMLRRLSAERAAGLAYDLEELDRGVCAVSAPVLERDGGLRAVVTLVAPAERFGMRDRKKKAEALRNATARMSQFLNGAPGDD